MQCTYNLTFRRVRVTIVAVEKQQKKITHSESVFVTLGVQHAMGMRHTVICGQSGSAIFSHIIS